MRKILLATTALVGIAITGAAQAASSPVTVNIGGDVDFLAANFAAANAGTAFAADKSSHRDFESIYNLDFSILGKANSGLEYGGIVGLTNTPDIQNAFGALSNGNGSTPYLNQGYIWMSSAFGKLQLGDSRGATDLALLAPVAGEGQVYGRYIDFLNTMTFAKTMVAGVDVTDHSTNVTYFTPKVGNDNNKVQLGVSFVPEFYNYGSSVNTYTSSGGYASAFGTSNNSSPYHDVVKGAAAYEGKFAPVAVKASAQVLNGSSDASAVRGSGPTWIWNAPTGEVRNFTAWGLGAQAALDGFTFGGNYMDEGHYNTIVSQTKSQDVYSAALKYEFNKATVGVSYLGGEAYSNTLALTTPAAGSAFNYVKDFNSYGAGGSYVWAPGLTSNLDGVYFDQKTDGAPDNKGYVLLVSQKLSF